MATLASALIGKAKILAQDTTAIRWPDVEWLGWMTDAEREICIIRPSAFSKIASIPIIAGSKQAIPAGGIVFIEYIRAMGAGGATPGNVARKVPRQLLDSQNPSWHMMAATAAPTHYVFEPQAPKTFYVYPPNVGGQTSEVIYGATPAPITEVWNNINLDDVYGSPIIDYMMYRAYLKDSEMIGNAERSMLFRKAFENTMGLSVTGQAGTMASDSIRG